VTGWHRHQQPSPRLAIAPTVYCWEGDERVTCIVCVGEGKNKSCLISCVDCKDWSDFANKCAQKDVPISCDQCSAAHGPDPDPPTHTPIGGLAGVAVLQDANSVVRYSPTDVRIRWTSGQEAFVGSDAAQAAFDVDEARFMEESVGAGGLRDDTGPVSDGRAAEFSRLLAVSTPSAPAGGTPPETHGPRRFVALVVAGIVLVGLVGIAFATGLVGGSDTPTKTPATTTVAETTTEPPTTLLGAGQPQVQSTTTPRSATTLPRRSGGAPATTIAKASTTLHASTPQTTGHVDTTLPQSTTPSTATGSSSSPVG
jgi:hypothetical protein